jgi:hypothetical protein
MSRRNGDRSRFHINQKRKIRRRQRVRALLAGLSERKEATTAASHEGAASTDPRERRKRS